MNAPAPWPMERRSRMTRKMEREAKHVAARIGASKVVIIGFFEEGQHVHMIDAGEAPCSRAELWKRLSGAVDLLEQSGGKDVQLQ